VGEWVIIGTVCPGAPALASSTRPRCAELAEAVLVLWVVEQTTKRWNCWEQPVKLISTRCAHICLLVFWHLLLALGLLSSHFVYPLS